MGDTLKRLRGKKYVGTAQLADQAARLIDQFAPHQERASVTEVPDERMVRYYSTEGLISSPEGRQGPAAVYGYIHLLQLLAIKRLQAEHLPIKKIRDLVESKAERDLEQLLEIDKRGQKREGPFNSATSYLESLLTSPPRAAPAPVAESYTEKPTGWRRIEIEPGLELHMREDYRLTDDSRERRRLARRVFLEIEKNGRPPRK
jgi:DNA-binding transcriptional MerR regulator